MLVVLEMKPDDETFLIQQGNVNVNGSILWWELTFPLSSILAGSLHSRFLDCKTNQG